MTYANVVFSYDTERFLSACREAGIDGLILPDLPYEEKEEFLGPCREYGVDLISMIAPTSADRVAMIAREAEGFLYLVSSLGVTGERSEIKTDLRDIIRTVRENAKVPCAVGFGISTPEQARQMAAGRVAHGEDVLGVKAVFRRVVEHPVENRVRMHAATLFHRETS